VRGIARERDGTSVAFAVGMVVPRRLATFLLTGALVVGTLVLLPACLAGDGSDGEEEPVGETESALNTGCVRSNFNCKLPDHPHDEVDRNRFFTQTGNVRWTVEPGTVAVDGRGEALGTVISQVSINYGQRKVIGGKKHVFGFSFTLAGGNAASAWIEESRVRGDTSRMPTILHGNPGRGDGKTYVIDGGNPAKFIDAQGRDLKISEGGVGNLEANDYLVRGVGNVHLLYSVPGFKIGGLATDTFRADRGTLFVRTANVGSITVPTRSVSGARGPDMRFVYGRVGSHRGWIAYDALRVL
jgi:hypothetical protein